MQTQADICIPNGKGFVLYTIPQRFVPGSLRWIPHACFHGIYERVHIFTKFYFVHSAEKEYLQLCFLLTVMPLSVAACFACTRMLQEGAWPHG